MSIDGSLLRQRRQELGLSQARLSELTGVSQHRLSAFELQKTALPDSVLEVVLEALSDNPQIENLVTRSKRYRQHDYSTIDHLPERVAKCALTQGNIEYCQLLSQIAEGHQSKKSHNLSALSLFSGCGGFSLGFSAAGFKVKGFLELVEDFRRIYRLNFPQTTELGGDITTADQGSLQLWAEKLGEIDVIIGGPPCQGFSLSGKRRVDDPRNALFQYYLRFVDAFRPKIAVLENVRLLTSMRTISKELVKDVICRDFRNHGYKIRPFEVNAKDYGVPQHRERVLFVAVRDDLGVLPSVPNETHTVERDLFAETLPFRTFADACSDLPYIESGEKSTDVLHEAVKHPKHVIEWLWDVLEGCSAHNNDEPSKRPPSGYNTTYKRQVWDEPASTVQTTFGMISGCRNVHPIATRSLTIREAARIQSFPDTYIFQGSLGAIRTAIGNAVPPLLAYTIAKHVGQLLDSIKVTRL